MNPADMDRADLEIAVLEYDILPIDAAAAMSDEALRAAVVAWIAAGDECASA